MAEVIVRFEEETKKILQDTTDQFEKVGELLQKIADNIQEAVNKGTTQKQ